MKYVEKLKVKDCHTPFYFFNTSKTHLYVVSRKQFKYKDSDRLNQRIRKRHNKLTVIFLKTVMTIQYKVDSRAKYIKKGI